jgi:hypothetical protein
MTKTAYVYPHEEPDCPIMSARQVNTAKTLMQFSITLCIFGKQKTLNKNIILI